MITAAVAAFVGCLVAMIVLAEVGGSNKWLRYLIAFVIGILCAILLAMGVEKVAALFGRVG